MGFGASKARKVTASSKADKHTSAKGAKPKMPTSTSSEQAAAQREQQRSRGSNNTGSENSNSNPSLNAASGESPSPAEARGFNHPKPARRETIDTRAINRQTRMVGAEDMNGTKEDLDERPFHQEKVSRVPTKALLKPPKTPNSLIADPDDDFDYDLEQ